MPSHFQSRAGLMIWIIAPLFIVFSFLATMREKDPQKVFEKRHIYRNKQYNWKLGTNPPPPKLSTNGQSDKLYVMILDSEFESRPHQCIMKRQWMDPFLEHVEVDGIEVYSANAWTNKECNLSSITIPELPEQKINPGAFLLYESLKLFLERSDAGWLYIIGDAAYIKVDRFFAWLGNIMKSHSALTENFIIGSCVEERYFFQMLLTSSGVLLSRAYVKRLVATRDDDLWDVSMAVGITADEILAKISDKIGVYIPGKQTSDLVGRGFTDASHYKILMDKDFDNLPKCNIPQEYLRPFAGELGLCTAQIMKFNDIRVWSATRHLGKQKFLEDAEEMLNNNPDSLGYYWDRLYLTLCKLY
ncbi:hypothetical protein TVAG_256870 [Trichomonas vaginalis G3]|uniref:Hexosyltransferase n=1 Tax=Trichomonas vaginalis (strain ATCC PRA-98 / G3) TaxID=412133 RepID=A2FEZ3_TRIV3|nr:hypothetical protein TVAGG3_0046780 [Trichomonas vaginalis G3]EAX96547.1 hypothetical protein TVAG_256870 [Trichomonas vaginalis G3]KAI5541085.1 hypothetical protein TVAGG3_0046780 [Trichomonas vaginalis G3]|eukprot:XP_001309477.1 hypothetical protein [Trichomonas vaginalis G3]